MVGEYEWYGVEEGGGENEGGEKVVAKEKTTHSGSTTNRPARLTWKSWMSMLLVSLCTSLLLMLSRSVFCVFSRVCASSVSMLAVVVVVKRLVIVLMQLDVLFQRLVALASTKGVTVEMRGRRGTRGQKVYQGTSLYSTHPTIHPPIQKTMSSLNQGR